MNIRNILNVYKRDWRSIIRNPVAMVILAGLCVIPSLYAWINIQACWNTYENTGTIPVAVVNNDKEVSFKDKKINIGNDVITKLKTNHKIMWKFVGTREADLGLADGTYYAMIEIPQDFSSSFLTVLSDNPKKPQITYKVDTKVNPVAGKITDAAKNTLVNEITTNFVSTVNETIFSSLNTVGKDANENQQDIIKMKDAIININNNMDAITGSLQSIHSSAGNLDQFLGSISAAMPSVQSSLAVIGQNSTKHQAMIASAQATLNRSISNIDLNLNYAQASNQRIEKLFRSLNDSVASANTSTVNSALPRINVELDSLNSAVDASIDYLEEYQSLDFNTNIDQTITLLQNLEKSCEELKTALTELQTQLGNSSATVDQLTSIMNTQIPKIETNLNTMDSSMSAALNKLESLNSSMSSAALTQAIDTLKAVQSSGFKTTLQNALNGAQSSQQNVKKQAAALSSSIDIQIKQLDALEAKLKAAVTALQSVETGNTAKKQQIANMIASLKKTQPYLADEKNQFSNIQQQLNATNTISKSIADSVNKDTAKINEQLTSSVKQYNSGVKSDLNTIGSNLTIAAKDASDLIQTAQSLNTQINSFISTAQRGSELASQFSGDLNSSLLEFKNVIQQLSSQFQLVENNDIAQIIRILQSNPKFMGELMSNPFDLKEESINAIPNYGSSMAPIYSTLALWVGCLLLNSILKTKVGKFKGVEKLTLKEKHFGKMMIFCTLAMIQAFIVSMGDILILHVYTVNAPLFVVFALASSLTFSMITFTLTSTLGNVGKAVGIIYMILQLAGSGGTYPIQVDPPVFRVLQPLFPFTYSVGGFREAIAGPLVSSVVLDFVALLLFAAVTLLCGYFLIEPLYKRVHVFEEKFKESGVGE